MIWRGLLGGLLLYSVAFGQNARPAPEAFLSGFQDDPDPKAALELIAHPDVLCAKEKNLLWCAAMQAAFDRIIRNKSPMTFVMVDPPNPVIDKMQKFPWKEEEVLPKDGWFAVSGPMTPELLRDAKEKWKDFTGQEPSWGPTTSPNANRLAAFTAIGRHFRFDVPFLSSLRDRMSWGEKEVAIKYFGTSEKMSAMYGNSVRVLAYDYSSPQQALQVLGEDVDDTMILYTPKEPQTMWEAMLWIRKWRTDWTLREDAKLKWNDKYLHEKDNVRIPQISTRSSGNYGSQLAGAMYFQGHSMPWMVFSTDADNRLDVDYQGVKFSFGGSLSVGPFGERDEPVQITPRRFWFDRPFFLFLWRDRAEWPYAGVWFGNADAFVK